MQPAACSVRQGRHIGHRHQHTGFVVGGHERDQRHIRANQRCSRRQVQCAISQHRDEVHWVPLVCQAARQPQVPGVFNAAEQHTPAC